MASNDQNRRNRRAWELGYENDYERRQLRGMARNREWDKLYQDLDPVIARLAADEDYGSIGEIFADIYGQLPESMDRTTFLRGIFSPTMA